MDQLQIILLAAVGIIAALVGWFLGRANGRNTTTAEHEAELAEKDSAYDILQKEHTHKSQLLSALQQKQAELERRQAGFDAELKTWQDQAKDTQQKWDVLNKNYALVSTEFQTYKVATNSQLGELARVNQGLEAHIKATREDMLLRDAKIATFEGDTALLKQQLESAQRQVIDLEATISEQKSAAQSAAQSAELKQTELQDEIASLKMERADFQSQTDGEKADLEQQLIQEREHVAALQTSEQTLQATLETREAEIAELKNALETLQGQHRELQENYQFLEEEESLAVQNLESLEAEYTAVATDLQHLKTTMGGRMRERRELLASNSALHTDNERLQQEMDALNGRYHVEISSALDDLESYKRRIAALNAEVQNNRIAIANLEAENERLRRNPVAAIPIPVSTTASEGEEAVLERIQQRRGRLDFSRIGEADPSQRDDFETITGIGPFTQRKLNALGLYTFRQLAALTDDDVDAVNDAIEFIPGRIRRDEWVRQAQERI